MWKSVNECSCHRPWSMHCDFICGMCTHMSVSQPVMASPPTRCKLKFAPPSLVLRGPSALQDPNWAQTLKQARTLNIKALKDVQVKVAPICAALPSTKWATSISHQLLLLQAYRSGHVSSKHFIKLRLHDSGCTCCLTCAMASDMSMLRLAMLNTPTAWVVGCKYCIHAVCSPGSSLL